MTYNLGKYDVLVCKSYTRIFLNISCYYYSKNPANSGVFVVFECFLHTYANLHTWKLKITAFFLV